MAKRKISIAFIVLGLLLGTAALGLVAYNLWDNNRAGNEAEKAVEAIARHRDKHGSTADSASKPPADMNSGLENDWDRELPVLEIDGKRYIGTLTIPSLEIELPVQESWSLALLKVAPCRYTGSPYRGDLILCAHNYNTHFGKLKNMTPGDAVIFTDVEGNAFHYTVAELDNLAGTAVAEMESGEWDLTLFTCTLDGQTRVTVRCNLSERTENNE